MRKSIILVFLLIASVVAIAQDSLQTKKDTVIHANPLPDTTVAVHRDTTLRIINVNPYFSVHVDSLLTYQFEINKNPSNYYWYLRNAPVGIRINKDNGILSFRADKSYFLSGRLRYDYDYKVTLGVQNLSNASEKVETTITVVFFNTEIIPSVLKPTISGTVWIDEGETLRFKVLCENGSFPIENIITLTSMPIGEFSTVQACGDEFRWTPTYDFVKDTDANKMKPVTISFIGNTKFNMHDTVQVKVVVKNALNYPMAIEQYNQIVHDMNDYILRLKLTFLVLDKSIKKTKHARTGFDLTAAGAGLGGTILSSNPNTQKTGTILPSVGVALQPIKEASAPNKTAEQNQATLVRSSIKRLEYVVQDNALVGEKDPDIAQKTSKLKEELKQSQMQLIDVPIEITNNIPESKLNKYFNSPKVNKKYRLK